MGEVKMDEKRLSFNVDEERLEKNALPKKMDWKESIRRALSLQEVDLDTGKNGWAAPPCNSFNVRASGYFARKIKSPADSGEGSPQRGNHAACLLGKAVTCHYLKGPNYLEIDVDMASSTVANAILHLALGYVTSVAVDLAFLIESQTEEELPETLLGAVRVAHMEISSASSLEQDPETLHEKCHMGTFQSVMSWRKFGRSFTFGKAGKVDAEEDTRLTIVVLRRAWGFLFFVPILIFTGECHAFRPIRTDRCLVKSFLNPT
ncbi:hypothetical protein R1flu_001786 [Riccia fluitans]|uniref:Protein ENHANCED DISEASE RESISTANCE 2 C-terminal domain-containing protein n=1 Tax=Riccia fluitans TaxID=41844 RepID=A0ABD1Y4A2_9MARC